MIKSLTPKEYMEVMEYLQKNCSLTARLKNRGDFDVPSIKYVDSCYDSRSGTWWSITFRTWGGARINLRSNYFVINDKETSPYSSLYEWCMAFLKAEWVATENFYENG